MARTPKAAPRVKKERKPMTDAQKLRAAAVLAKRMGGVDELAKQVAAIRTISKLAAV